MADGNENKDAICSTQPFSDDPLIQHYHLSFDELPEGLREYATIVAAPINWDSLSAEARIRKSKEVMERDQNLFAKAFDDALEVQAVEQEIMEMKTTPANTPSELIIKNDYISNRRKLIEMIKSRVQASPAEMVLTLKNKGYSEPDIARELKLSGCSTYVIGSLLPANPGTKIAHASISRRGNKLIEKGQNEK